MKTVLLAGLLVLAAGDAPAPLGYRVESAKGKVVIRHDQIERRAVAGEAAVAGDGIRTGWFGHAMFAAPTAAARFEIFPRTEAELAGPEPGVLITVRKGMIKAAFDALTGTDDRLVSTPGALLAVRGTRYGVEVDADGQASLAVFEGVVEVRSRMPGAVAVGVHAGEQCSFAPRQAPQRQAMPRGWSEDGWRGAGNSRGRPEGAPDTQGQGTGGRQPGGQSGGRH